MHYARLRVAGYELGFGTASLQAFEYLAGLQHIGGVTPYEFERIDFVENGPHLIYNDLDDYNIHYDASIRKLTVEYPWDTAPALFNSEEPFHNILIYSVRFILELFRQEEGQYTLHASAIAHDRGAVLLSGPSEAGKTTLALHLCRTSNFAMIANDQTVIGLRDGRPAVVHGQPTINLRYSSMEKYSSTLAQSLFEKTATEIRPWDRKLEISPSQIGIEFSAGEAPLKIFARIKIDDSLDECVATELSKRHRSPLLPSKQEFFFRIALYQEITSVIRGSSFTPMREFDLELVNLFPPSLDSEILLKKRVEFINCIFNSENMILVDLRGSLENCSEYIVKKISQ